MFNIHRDYFLHQQDTCKMFEICSFYILTKPKIYLFKIFRKLISQLEIPKFNKTLIIQIILQFKQIEAT